MSLRREVGGAQFDQAITTETGRALLQANLIAGTIDVIDPAKRAASARRP